MPKKPLEKVNIFLFLYYFEVIFSHNFKWYHNLSKVDIIIMKSLALKMLIVKQLHFNGELIFPVCSWYLILAEFEPPS